MRCAPVLETRTEVHAQAPSAVRAQAASSSSQLAPSTRARACALQYDRTVRQLVRAGAGGGCASSGACRRTPPGPGALVPGARWAFNIFTNHDKPSHVHAHLPRRALPPPLCLLAHTPPRTGHGASGTTIDTTWPSTHGHPQAHVRSLCFCGMMLLSPRVPRGVDALVTPLPPSLPPLAAPSVVLVLPSPRGPPTAARPLLTCTRAHSLTCTRAHSLTCTGGSLAHMYWGLTRSHVLGVIAAHMYWG